MDAGLGPPVTHHDGAATPTALADRRVTSSQEVT